MANFEILCVTMKQKNFSKIKEMNVTSDIVYANQTDITKFEEIHINGHYAKMISTNTRGVGINRNIALMYATADYCMLSDDDVIYYDNLEEKVLNEFQKFKNADIIIFNIDSEAEARKQRKITKSRKSHFWDRMSWGAVRIAIKLNSIKKNNIWFSSLFGGGCVYPSGEDSIFLLDARKKGLNIYLSNQVIGKTDFSKSSWFSGYNENYYFGKGAFYQSIHKKTFYLWLLYISIRTRGATDLAFIDRMRCIIKGKRSFLQIGEES